MESPGDAGGTLESPECTYVVFEYQITSHQIQIIEGICFILFQALQGAEDYWWLVEQDGSPDPYDGE